MLAAIDFDNELELVIGEIGKIRPNLDLPAKMRSLQIQPMPEMPPEFTFRFGRFLPHAAREYLLRWRLGSVGTRPYPMAVVALPWTHHHPHP
jgi:hypothetical protein